MSSDTKRAASRFENGARGFTLVELMVVLIIISMFAVMIVPSVVSAMRDETAPVQAEKLCELLRFAYVSAITRHRPVQTYLEARRGLCLVSVANPTLPWLEGEEEQQSSTRTLASFRLPEGVQMRVERGEGMEMAPPAQEGQPIVFRSNGQADSARIVLTDARGQETTIEIMGTTGEILIREVTAP